MAKTYVPAAPGLFAWVGFVNALPGSSRRPTDNDVSIWRSLIAAWLMVEDPGEATIATPVFVEDVRDYEWIAGAGDGWYVDAEGTSYAPPGLTKWREALLRRAQWRWDQEHPEAADPEETDRRGEIRPNPDLDQTA